MTTPDQHTPTAAGHPSSSTAGKIGLGLLLGVLCGVLCGEYCGFLQIVGHAYVGLLQMTVLPYLTTSLIAKLGRLDFGQARRLGQAGLAVLLILWIIGVLLVVAVSGVLPPIQGASFFSPPQELSGTGEEHFLSMFIPANVFRSLSNELVPAVVVFCLLFGAALIGVPGKEPLLDFLDLCTAVISRINVALIRLAPFGLFALTAAAAGTIRVQELSRLQAYIIMFALACVLAAFGILPLLVSSLTHIGYRAFLRAGLEPLLTAFATGKLFVVLPQIVEKCEQLLQPPEDSPGTMERSTANVLVPMAYAFPHIGKILPFVFVAFAAWYVGRDLSAVQTFAMAAMGAVTSFAGPLVTMPFLLDQYQLPQDLMSLFILPGFITTRLADLVGVLHLMALTLIVSEALQGRLRVRWRQLFVVTAALLVCLGVVGAGSRQYLASTTLEYDLDDRLLSLEIPSPHTDVVTYKARHDVPSRAEFEGSTLQRVKTERVLRVGYSADHLPYTFFNRQQRLVGLDVELMHRLAVRLQIRLEFVPYKYDTVIEQLETDEIDVAIGGLIMKPTRFLRVGFTQPYQTATLAVVLPDYRRSVLVKWEDPDIPVGLRLAIVGQDLAAAARRQLPTVDIIAIDSISSFFTAEHDFNGLIIAAEEGAAWNILYPEHTVLVPRPIIRRPVGMAVRSRDAQWLNFLDRWLEFERLDGSLDRLRTFWIEGGATQQQPPRWCVLRDVLHWLP